MANTPTTHSAPATPPASPPRQTERLEEDSKRVAQAAAQTVERTVSVVRKGGIDERDVVGGNVSETINQPSDAGTRDRTRAQRVLFRAARAAGTAKVGALVGRPLDEWGLFGQGDTVTGHYMLIDLDTLKKVEVTERMVIAEDRIFANAQQWPKALVHGDLLETL